MEISQRLSDLYLYRRTLSLKNLLNFLDTGGDTNFSACVILNTVSRRVKISTCHNVKYVNILKEKCPKVCGFCGSKNPD